MLDVSGHKWAFSGPENELFELDSLGLSKEFVEKALKIKPSSETLEHLLVFHSWKSGLLDLVRFHLNTGQISLSADALLFLEAHELRQKGLKAQSIAMIEKLKGQNSDPTIQYRALADSIEEIHLENAIETLSQAIRRFSGWRRSVLLFNLGVAALNKDQFSASAAIAKDLEESSESVSQYFSLWLKAQIFNHRGEISKSLECLHKALQLCQEIPSRGTDQSILLCNAIDDCLWLGRREEAEIFLEQMLTTKKEGRETLSKLRLASAHAQVLALRGHLNLAFEHLDAEFSSSPLSRDHLMVSFFYLWLLILVGQERNVFDVVQNLEEVRDQLGQSSAHFDYGAFKVFEEPMGHYRNSKWSKPLSLFSQDDPYALIEDLIQIEDQPWLVRALICKFSHDPRFESLTFWRILATTVTDPLSKRLSLYKFHSFFKDLESILDDVKALFPDSAAWLQNMSDTETWFRSGLLKCLSKGELGFDTYSGKIINLKTREVLSPQNQIAQFLNALGDSTQGLNKEQISKVIGNLDYNPLFHDAQIYALVSRARQWLGKQSSGVDVTHDGGRWHLVGRSRLIVFGPAKDTIYSVIPEKKEPLTNDRHVWIRSWLNHNGQITRADLLKQFPIKKSTAVNDFNELLKKNVLERFGQGRSVYYKLKRA